jgi:hypothetical protein
MNDPRLERFAEAYLAMARQARYRPQAPSEGFGNILLTPKQCGDIERLRREAVAYALGFSAEEDERTFWIGCSDFETNRAFVWTIEAARLLAGGKPVRATRLLNMAVKEIGQVQQTESGGRNPPVRLGPVGDSLDDLAPTEEFTMVGGAPPTP